jgi:hypothetical protein
MAKGPVTVTELLALCDDGTLLRFLAERPAEVRRVAPQGVAGRLIGIDRRPADGALYGLTDGNDLYRLDAETGRGTRVSALTVPFDGDARSGIDFNPQADRLRLVSRDGQNLRVNVALGATAVDGALRYADGDSGARARPRITAAAYTHDVADAPDTKLFEIDGERDVLVLQDPPNDGVLATVGPLGVDFGPTGGFDIVTDPGGVDRGYAASGASLYAVDLGAGTARSLGQIGDGRAGVVGLAATGR